MDQPRDFTTLRVDYSLSSGISQPVAIRQHKDPDEAICVSLYLITKSLLLAILFLLAIWTLLELIVGDQFQRQQRLATPATTDDRPDGTAKLIESISIMSRVLVLFMCIIGVVALIRESFSLAVVFTTFVIIRLIAIFYLQPFLLTGPVATGLMFLVAIMSILFVVLVRGTAGEETGSVYPSGSSSDRFTVQRF